ncbi:hypothetical protein [Amycolatopsis regifaucium]|uniref:WXG100 family type VII secretion target n=1 Tax=Amycolatopsis regifaucium TaxID=546365 RepID=A0A154MEW0_9PSEU|nr:hypothetical protein [Amycolatopsis regifaucium]KZB83074.1 hypothetical protein AVL48_36815 [Amycolatopsis regifaucium]OKA03135.1 hypothetical protein ATP06_0237775 [Amycolatopsis regifaucium]SFJ12725.1 hypothetical protein SAMN04489731_1163 [Amycolatopsis regifaucium]
MAETFRLDPEEASAAAARLGALGERLKDSLRALESTLDDRHGCWGQDDIGEAFAKNYVGPAEKTREGAHMAGDGTVQLKDGINKNVSVLRNLDQKSAARIDASSGQNG